MNNYNSGRYQIRQGGGYYNQRSDWRGGNGNNYSRNSGQPAKKRSGCKRGFAHGDQSAPYVTGWNASKRYGMTSIIAGPYKNTKQVTSKGGRVWENWCAKVRVGRNQEYLTSALYDVASGRVIIKSLGFVMNPNKNYCGGFGRK